jgi:protein O-mannosyl-transferase
MSAPRQEQRTGRHGIWVALALAIVLAAVWATFGRAVAFDFVAWDDDRNIYLNPHIRTLGADSLRFMLTDASYVRIYMPLSWLTLGLVHAAFGLAPWAYHLANLIAHSANCVLVFLLVDRLLRRRSQGAGPASVVAALVGTLLWALHPMRTEVVCRASDIFHAQATLLALLAAHAYLSSRSETDAALYRRPAYWACVAFYAASLLSYPHAIGGAAALVAVETTLARRDRTQRGWSWLRDLARIAVKSSPLLALTGLALAATAWGRLHTTFFAPPATLAEFGLGARLMQACYIWAYYLWKPLVPLGLGPLYTPLMEFRPWQPVFVASAILVLLVTALAFRLRRRMPALAGAWIVHLVLLVPFLGLSEHPHYSADRYSYLASVPWAVVLALGVNWALERRRGGLRPAVAVAGALSIGTSAWLAHRQTTIWQNTTTLFTHILRQVGDHPARAAVYLRLGVHHLNQGRFSEAVAWFDRTLELRPSDFPALGFKGRAQASGGDLEAAVPTLRAALAERADPRLHELLAATLLDLGRRAEARGEIEAAIALDPTSVAPRLWLADILEGEGRTAEAAAAVEAALRLDPGLEEARKRLGRLRRAAAPP